MTDAQLRDQLRTQLAIAGLDLDDARLEALLPAYAAARAGVRRIDALQLGDTEPAVAFWVPAPDAGRAGA